MISTMRRIEHIASVNSLSSSNKSVFSGNELARDNGLTTGHKTPTSRTERLIQDSSVLDLGQVDDSIGLDLNVVKGDLLCKDSGSFGAERLRRNAME